MLLSLAIFLATLDYVYPAVVLLYLSAKYARAHSELAYGQRRLPYWLQHVAISLTVLVGGYWLVDAVTLGVTRLPLIAMRHFAVVLAILP